ESRTNRTLPSAKAAFTPPANGLRADSHPCPCPVTSGVGLFGGRAAVNPLVYGWPQIHDPSRFPVQRVALSASAVVSGGFSPPGAVGTGLRPALALAYRRRRWSGVKADSGPVTLASVPRR